MKIKLKRPLFGALLGVIVIAGLTFAYISDNYNGTPTTLDSTKYQKTAAQIEQERLDSIKKAKLKELEDNADAQLALLNEEEQQLKTQTDSLTGDKKVQADALWGKYLALLEKEKTALAKDGAVTEELTKARNELNSLVANK